MTVYGPDTTSTDITDSNGNLIGVFVDGGTLASGKNNEVNVRHYERKRRHAGVQGCSKFQWDDI